MTFYVLDVASYQGDLAATDVVRAGFDAVNLKVSHGLGLTSVHPDITGWVSRARSLQLGLSTFHFMTTEGTGEQQAEWAYSRLVALGLAYGAAHVLDVESSPVPAVADVRGYLARMTELLGRPVAVYTGDWYWQPKGWNVSDLSPYLWAAPNPGYLAAYPGDNAITWNAGYGGWPVLSAMQYLVSPLTFPDGTTGTIRVSKSAIRDPMVWRALTQGRPGMSYAPETLSAARTLYLATLKPFYAVDPLSVGIIGDDSHAKAGTSYHLGEDALRADAYSIVESSRDRNGLTNAASASDLGWFSFTLNGKTHNLRTFSVWLAAQCAAGADFTADMREVIYSPDGKVVKRWDRLGKRTTGDNSHLIHTHVSWFRDSEKRDKTAFLRAYFTSIGILEDDVSEQDVTNALTKFFAVGKQPAEQGGLPESKIGHDAGAQGVPDERGGKSRVYELEQRMAIRLVNIEAMLTAMTGQDNTDEAAIVAGVLAGLTPDLLAQAFKLAGVTPEAFAAALPADLAESILNALVNRIRPSA